jgi:hypothetical protein
MAVFGFKSRQDALAAKQLVQDSRLKPTWQEGQSFSPVGDIEWTNEASLAVITEQLPARVGRTAGGPVEATFIRIDETDGSLTDETGPSATVNVWSWATVPSQDPEDLPNDEHFIWIGQDRNGVWWLCNEECFDV